MSEAVFGPWRKSSHSGNESNCVELAWRKSRYSGDESNCVELAWRESSYSGNEGNCVELAHGSTTGAIRDSKNPDAGHLDVPLAGLISMAKSLAT